MYSFRTISEPWTMTVNGVNSHIYGGDVLRLTHDGKRSVMRIYWARPHEGGFRVWATRKQWDRKGRMTQRGKRRGYYFIPRGTDVTVIAGFSYFD